jgi:hypothetical protein
LERINHPGAAAMIDSVLSVVLGLIAALSVVAIVMGSMGPSGPPQAAPICFTLAVGFLFSRPARGQSAETEP